MAADFSQCKTEEEIRAALAQFEAEFPAELADFAEPMGLNPVADIEDKFSKRNKIHRSL